MGKNNKNRKSQTPQPQQPSGQHQQTPTGKSTYRKYHRRHTLLNHHSPYIQRQLSGQTFPGTPSFIPSDQQIMRRTPQDSAFVDKPSFTPTNQQIMRRTQQSSPHFSSPFFLYNYESKSKNLQITNTIPFEQQTSILSETKTDKAILVEKKTINPIIIGANPKENNNRKEEKVLALSSHIRWGMANEKVQRIEGKLTELETSNSVDRLNTEVTAFTSGQLGLLSYDDSAVENDEIQESDTSTEDGEIKEYKKSFEHNYRKERKVAFASIHDNDGKTKEDEIKIESGISSIEKQETNVTQSQIESQFKNLKLSENDSSTEEKNKKLFEEDKTPTKSQDELIQVEESIELISDSSVSTIKSDDRGKNSQDCSFSVSDQKVVLEAILQESEKDCEKTLENKIPPSTPMHDTLSFFSKSPTEYYDEVSFQTPKIKTSQSQFLNIGAEEESRRISSGLQIPSVSATNSAKSFDMDDQRRNLAPSNEMDGPVHTPQSPSTSSLTQNPSFVHTSNETQNSIAVQTPNLIQNPGLIQIPSTPSLIQDPSSIHTPNLIQNPSSTHTPDLIQNSPTSNLTQSLSSVQTPSAVQNPETPMKIPTVVIQNHEILTTTPSLIRNARTLMKIQNPETPMNTPITPRYNLRTRTSNSANVSMKMRTPSLHTIEEKIPNTPFKSTQITESFVSTTIDDFASTSSNNNNIQTPISKNEFSTSSTVRYPTTPSRTPKPWPLEIEVLRERLGFEFRRRNITQKELVNEIFAIVKTLPGSDGITFSQSSCSNFLRGISKPRSTIVFDAMRKWIDSQMGN
ncbi:1577_t:CDS:2 [Ambispora leptoticha]|uniref:1577_t:CDS:1 n=1 Tax=Ambispora leptoticha TaxID=144679 RepID=A0A9N9DAB3_9GLOM|nr:1577_t:CDS:2 [Ambispora leptoticha]